MSLSNNFPTVSPTLNLNFAAAGRLDSRVTFTRSSTATYVNQIGLIQSAAVNEPRFDYDPSTLAARGLLIEEQRTNSILYSEQFDNAAWTKNAVTVTTNAIAAPDGTITADKLVESATTSVHWAYESFTGTAASYTVSVYAKAGERSFLLIRLDDDSTLSISYFDLSTGVVSLAGAGATCTITSFENGWYRCSVTRTLTVATYYVVIGLSTASGTNSYPGDGTSGIYVWGAQLEQGSFSTSYIPTVASSVTRSADVASVNTLSPWYNASAGTLFAEIGITNPIGAANQYAAEFHNGTANNRIILYRGTGTNTTSVYIADAGVAQASITAGSAIAINSVVKQALGFAANDIGLTSNASAVSTDTSATIPTVNKLNIGSSYGGDEQLNGHIRRIAYYPARLTNAQLQALTL